MSEAGRLPLVDADARDDAFGAVFDRFREAGHEVPVLYRALANAPAMLNAWVAMAWPLRHDATTSRALRELVIMRVAQLTKTPYEWISHRPAALKYGITESQLADLHAWAHSDRFTAAEREVLALADAITEQIEVPDDVWAPLAVRYGPGELVELILTAAFYACVSRTLRALALPVDTSHPDLTGF